MPHLTMTSGANAIRSNTFQASAWAPAGFTLMQPPRQASRVSMGVVIAMHAAAVPALLSYEPAQSAMREAMPIMVEFIAPQPELANNRSIKLPPPNPAPAMQPAVHPMVQPAQPVQPLQQAQSVAAPVLTASASAPSPVTATAATTTSAAPVNAVTASAASDAVAATAAAVTQPVFNAAYLNNPAPAYPPLSRRMREQGQVLLRVLVNAAGRADDVQLRASSGFPRLDDSARETVRDWKFVPARRGSDPVAAWVLVPINFRMES